MLFNNIKGSQYGVYCYHYPFLIKWGSQSEREKEGSNFTLRLLYENDRGILILLIGIMVS